MPFIPHTPDDITEMLAAIGVKDTEALFDEIPQSLRVGTLAGIPDALNEFEITRLMQERAQQDGGYACYLGAGAYEHHIPAAVWEITTRGEFYTAYTPYQAEASQGTLQLLYEFQTMMASLTGMDASNASLYDGASALAEAALMAIRANRASKSRRLLVAESLNPIHRKVLEAIVSQQGIHVETIPLDAATGTVDMGALNGYRGQDIAAVMVQQPNFFGQLEDVDTLTNWAHENKTLIIGSVNPTSLAVLTPPGEWGQKGADIACGDGQPLGVPLSSGGPYYGFMCCKMEHVRQMPGRIVGRTVDLEGKTGYTLTLQAREQHIRRSKATSNICTNQGLVVTASTIYMTLLGAEGLSRVAAASLNNTASLTEQLCQIPGVSRLFTGDSFHETALRLPISARAWLAGLLDAGIIGGYDLSQDYPSLGSAVLICVTETKTADDIARYVKVARDVISKQRAAA